MHTGGRFAASPLLIADNDNGCLWQPSAGFVESLLFQVGERTIKLRVTMMGIIMINLMHQIAVLKIFSAPARAKALKKIR